MIIAVIRALICPTLDVPVLRLASVFRFLDSAIFLASAGAYLNVESSVAEDLVLTNIELSGPAVCFRMMAVQARVHLCGFLGRHRGRQPESCRSIFLDSQRCTHTVFKDITTDFIRPPDACLKV
jgi:hypothetical protein